VIGWASRALDRIRFILRTALLVALAWGCGGLVVAVAPPLAEPWPGASDALRVGVQLALGFGIGWWLGLLWGAVWAVRSTASRIGAGRIWLPAGLATGLALALRWGGVAPRWAVLAGIALATLAAMLQAQPAELR
jgi:hypothetical protein